MATAFVTGGEWRYDDGKRIWVADFDPDAIRDIPVSWVDFFADLGSPYLSHTVIYDAPLVLLGSTATTDGLIKLRMATDGTGTLKSIYPFTVRGVAADGQRDDQTLWLRLVAR